MLFRIGDKIDITDFSDTVLLWMVFAAGDHLRQETEFSSHNDIFRIFQNFSEAEFTHLQN